MKFIVPAAILIAAVSIWPLPVVTAAPNRCFMEAAENPIYVRVFNATEYGEKSDQIWSGWIQPYERMPVQSRHGNIIYDYKTAPENPYEGSFRRICDEDEIVRVVP